MTPLQAWLITIASLVAAAATVVRAYFDWRRERRCER